MSDTAARVEDMSYLDAWGRIGTLAEELVGHPDPVVAEKVTELLDWVDAVHRDGLGRLLEMTRQWRGEVFLKSVAEDEIVGTMLGAYGLGEIPDIVADTDRDAIQAALDTILPLAESHGGSIEVVDVKDGVVKVKMSGTCNGCASSSATLTYGLEAALKDKWVNFRRLEEVDASAEVNPETADLSCVPAPEGAPPAAASAVPEPEAPLLQIRGHEGR
ncbi:MAG TPA: NifU family protein [Acidimicrobiales bacterium]|nr:NifU family protein [Acidimicrobiales bacterium]